MIIHEESNSILLRIKNPELIRKVLPKHVRDISVQGHNLQVRHDLDAVKVLRNLGIKAPSPIRTQYNWPGRFVPFEHQKTTAEFLTFYSKAFVLNEMGCVDANTEYLSPTGWRRISDYDGGEVTQYDKDTGEGSFVQPTEYVKYPCKEMIRFKTTRGVDQLLSAEHRVAYVASTGGFMVKSAQEIETAYRKSKRGWAGRFITTFAGSGGEGVPLNDAELRVMVAVIADGHFGKATPWCVVRLKKPRKIARLRELLSNASIEYVETQPDYSGAEGFSVFKFYAPAREKEFGERYWQATPAQLQVVADEVWRWDGAVRKAGGVDFYSTSKASADFVQYCFSAVGRTATMSCTPRQKYKDLYVVHVQASAKLRYLKGATTAGAKNNNVWREASPDGFKYCFEVPKTFLVMRRNGCVFITGNTSKTASALWAADYLMRIGKIHKVLIISPLSTLEPVWQQEIFDVLMHRSSVLLHGARDKRFDLLASDADFYIINPDGVGIVADTVRKRLDIDLVIIDEAAAYRNGTTKRYKDLLKLLRPDVRLWLMTGTPCPNAPTDAWALAKLVNPTKVPQYFTSWKRQTMMQITSYKWVPRPDSYDMAFQAMQPAIRFKKSECLDLPPVTYENRTCELSPEQKQAYKEMKNYMAAEASSHQITAVNAADQVGKLRQILCGAFKNPDTGDYVAMDHAPRLKVLLECIQGAGAKVLVIVPYKGIINILKEEVEQHYTCDILNGDVSRTKRTEIITRFRRETDPHVLLCHPKVMAHGLTLTEADMVVFYAPIYSNEESQQVMDRINRPGQKLKMTIVRIGGATLEWSIYAMVEGKRLSQESILELYKKELEV